MTETMLYSTTRTTWAQMGSRDPRHLVNQFMKVVDSIRDAGGKVSPGWSALVRNFDQFGTTSEDHHYVAELAELVADPKAATPKQIEEAYALAVRSIVSKSGLDDTVYRRLLNAFEDEYATTTGRANFETFARRWDAVAKDYTEHARALDPSTPAELVVEMDAAAQDHWKTARLLAGKLDADAALLMQAANLVGWTPEMGRLRSAWDAGLFVTVRKTSDIPKVLAAWDTPDRWNNVIKAGGRLKTSTLDTAQALKALPTPRPYNGTPADEDDPEVLAII